MQRDLGVRVHELQNISMQVQHVLKKTSRLLSFIASGIEYKSKEVMLQLYKVLLPVPFQGYNYKVAAAKSDMGVFVIKSLKVAGQVEKVVNKSMGYYGTQHSEAAERTAQSKGLGPDNIIAVVLKNSTLKQATTLDQLIRYRYNTRIQLIWWKIALLHTVEKSRETLTSRLEIQYGEYWGTVCDLDWDLKDANVVCSQLQCGVAMSAPRYAHFGEGIGLIRSDIFECIGNETSLLDCRLFQGTQQECSHRNDASVICSGKHGPRLVDGMNRCSGRVEVLHRDQWWTLCDLYFDMEDANVVCEHLQCGTVNSIPGGAHFGKGTGPMWKENYRCRGNETRLWDCPVSSWDQFSCSHENDASVICTDENWSLRLTNGGSQCDGRVEIYHTGSWWRFQDRLWTLNDANVVCTQLGCGEATAAYNYSKDG
ncbi:scavenger receptor cysteine-rich type 1 protein M130-like, partial [Heterodontus francisci]|uniref:scavenger receptor cysteine-rich type 1 protein M130-like n=1 Tax=Heterodontus francisci TaxID=7792 RepID=UPI00355B3132